MENKTGEATAEIAYGVKLDKPITYTFSYNAYTSIDEVKAANDMPNDAQILKMRNDQRLSKARQAAQTAAFDAAGLVKPTAENNDQIRLKDMVKTLLTAKLPNGERRYTEEQARTLAATTLGVEWEE